MYLFNCYYSSLCPGLCRISSLLINRVIFYIQYIITTLLQKSLNLAHYWKCKPLFDKLTYSSASDSFQTSCHDLLFVSGCFHCFLIFNEEQQTQISKRKSIEIRKTRTAVCKTKLNTLASQSLTLFETTETWRCKASSIQMWAHQLHSNKSVALWCSHTTGDWWKLQFCECSSVPCLSFRSST